MRLNEAVNAYLRSRQRTVGNQKYLNQIAYSLTYLVDGLDNESLESLTPADVLAALRNIRARNGQRLADASRGSILRVWKLFFDYCLENGLIADRMREHLPFIETIPSDLDMPTQAEAKKAVASLIKYSQQSDSALRDALAFSLVYDSGCRSIALLELELDAVIKSLAGPGDPYKVVSHTKGDVDHTIRFFDRSAELIIRYIHVRPAVDVPYLLATYNGQLSESSLKLGFVRVCEFAGIPVYSPHKWRRRYISDLNRNGTDIATIQKVANHASPMTTLKHYINADEEHVEDEVRRLARRRAQTDGDDLAIKFFRDVDEEDEADEVDE